MSQRKQTYTTEEMIAQLRKMDAQVIHGSDFFSQCANAIDQLKQSNASMLEDAKKMTLLAFKARVCAEYPEGVTMFSMERVFKLLSELLLVPLAKQIIAEQEKGNK